MFQVGHYRVFSSYEHGAVGVFMPVSFKWFMHALIYCYF